MTTKQRLTIFGTSGFDFENMGAWTSELSSAESKAFDENTRLLRVLGVIVEDFDSTLGTDLTSWFISGVIAADIDRHALETALRSELKGHCWVLTEAEQSFDWTLPGIEDTRSDLTSLLLRDRALALELYPVDHRYRDSYLGSHVRTLSV